MAYQPITVAPGISCPFSRPSRRLPCAPIDSAVELLTYLATVEGYFSPFTEKQNGILDRSRFSVPSKHKCHLSPCCGSPTARAAACAGFTLGCASGLIGGAAGATGWAKWGVTLVSSIVAGTANASGTLLSTVESQQRDKRQDVLNEINREWRAAADHLIGEFLHARTNNTKSSWRELAYNILNREQALRAHFEARSLDTRENLNVLLQAASYVVDGHTMNDHVIRGQFPTDEGLCNQIATYDSPSNEEFKAYREQQQVIMTQFDSVLTELRAELAETKRKVAELEAIKK